MSERATRARAATRNRRTRPGPGAGAALAAWTALACPGPTATDAGASAADRATGDAGPAVCGAWPAGVAIGQLGLSVDSTASPSGALVLMGGGAEVDSAARTFVEGAGGGDVLVLRASGSVDSYTPYFHAELGAAPAPASVTTARLDQPALADDPVVVCHVDAAEALWLAGGDQADYLRGWPSSLQQAIGRAGARGAAVGGTSAGAMVLGEVAFDAALGSVTSAEALAAPLAAEVSVVRSTCAHPALGGAVVDTHFTDRDREGRLLVFAARALALLGDGPVLGVGLDEEAALVIDGARFAVQAAPGQRVWLYRVAGPAQLDDAAPLQLEGVARVALAAGATGSWPPDWSAWSATGLRVVQGSVVVE